MPAISAKAVKITVRSITQSEVGHGKAIATPVPAISAKAFKITIRFMVFSPSEMRAFIRPSPHLGGFRFQQM
jgi:hypothetical protein